MPIKLIRKEENTICIPIRIIIKANNSLRSCSIDPRRIQVLTIDNNTKIPKAINEPPSNIPFSKLKIL